MSLPGERNLALFIDFDNVAIGARDSRQRFDVRLLLQRVLEKGKVVVKRAYADWHYYKEHMTSLHEAAIELIEVPAPKISGKNSADIRMVVDAIDLCYAKSHIDTFVIVSGDSDFSPLVSKLRENDKRVIGIGVRASSSHLLIANCDEFIFYDDIYNSAVNKLTEKVSSVPQDLRQLFDFLLQTTQSLLQESRGVLYASLLKDTMKRKQPEFNESNYGYVTFGELLEDARDRGLLEVERDNRAGGTLVVLGLGKNEVDQENHVVRSRRRRRDRPRKIEGEQAADSQAAAGDSGAARPAAGESGATGKPGAQAEPGDKAAAASPSEKPSRSSRRSSRRRSRKKARILEPVSPEAGAAAASATPPPVSTEAVATAASAEAAKQTAAKAAEDVRRGTGKKKIARKTGKKTARRAGAPAGAGKTGKEPPKTDERAAKKAAKKTGKKTAKKAAGKKAGKTAGKDTEGAGG